MTPRNRWSPVANRLTRSSVSRPRPKKIGISDGVKARNRVRLLPERRNGFGSRWRRTDRLEPAPDQARASAPPASSRSRLARRRGDSSGGVSRPGTQAVEESVHSLELVDALEEVRRSGIDPDLLRAAPIQQHVRHSAPLGFLDRVQDFPFGSHSNRVRRVSCTRRGRRVHARPEDHQRHVAIRRPRASLVDRLLWRELRGERHRCRRVVPRHIIIGDAAAELRFLRQARDHLPGKVTLVGNVARRPEKTRRTTRCRADTGGNLHYYEDRHRLKRLRTKLARS